jgi:hypothetical protein
LPDDIPVVPDQTYKNEGWVSWGDWLGTGTIAPRLRIYRPFVQARDFVRGLNLRGTSEWDKFCKGEMPEKGTLPDDIPVVPDQTYKNEGWVSWGDWFGTGYIAPSLRIYRPFDQARGFVRGLNLKSRSEWDKFCKGEMPEKGTLPDDIPKVRIDQCLVKVKG